MIAVGRAFVAFLRGDGEATMTLASRPLAELGEGEWLLESLATALLGSAEWLCGRLDEAEGAMGSSVARWRDAGVHDMVAWWCQYLGQIQLAQGRLDRADETYRQRPG